MIEEKEKKIFMKNDLEKNMEEEIPCRFKPPRIRQFQNAAGKGIQ